MNTVCEVFLRRRNKFISGDGFHSIGISFDRYLLQCRYRIVNAMISGSPYQIDDKRQQQKRQH